MILESLGSAVFFWRKKVEEKPKPPVIGRDLSKLDAEGNPLEVEIPTIPGKQVTAYSFRPQRQEEPKQRRRLFF